LSVNLVMVNNMNEKCKNCKHLGMNLPCTVCLWNNDFYEPLAPTSPPEMPEVDPHLTLGENGTTPQVLGYCVRFKVKRGKKEANSCVGCTVGCPGKGKQEPGLPGHSLKGSDMEYDKILQQGPPSPPIEPLIAEPGGKESGTSYDELPL